MFCEHAALCHSPPSWVEAETEAEVPTEESWHMLGGWQILKRLYEAWAWKSEASSEVTDDRWLQPLPLLSPAKDLGLPSLLLSLSF